MDRIYKFTCVCVRHTFCQLAYRSDPSTTFYSWQLKRRWFTGWGSQWWIITFRGPKSPKNTILGPQYAFQAKYAKKNSNSYIYRSVYQIDIKFDMQVRPATETLWVVSYGGKTIPRWWTAAILKIVYRHISALHLWYPPFYTSPMASSALHHWTASPTKEGCHWQAGGENRQTWQLANAAWYT